MSKAVLLLGSNMGNRLLHLEHAVSRIAEEAGSIELCSGFYETEPWGNKLLNSFVNQVIQIETLYDPHLLMKILLDIEKAMGRVRNQKWEERAIDIDILYYDREIINDDKLQIPHPRLQERRFTLVPLVEILPEFEHPVLNKSSIELLEETSDTLDVNLLPYAGHGKKESAFRGVN
jgi:2-amino-4-hydroxy-6-hydroxymethyldihydropteridine diphosphokinase